MPDFEVFGAELWRAQCGTWVAGAKLWGGRSQTPVWPLPNFRMAGAKLRGVLCLTPGRSVPEFELTGANSGETGAKIAVTGAGLRNGQRQAPG